MEYINTIFLYKSLNSTLKRMIDLVLAVTGFIVAGPFMVFIAAAVWLDSPGPVIFPHERLGLKGKRFKLYKFRKFPPIWGNDGPAVTARNDVRMTRIGTLLERTKLDELPQLWNILRGDMTFVGPRPESPYFSHLFSGEYRELLDYIPGLFGPSQVRWRNESESYLPEEDPEVFYSSVLFNAKAKTDLDYFPRANVITDLRFIMQGVWVTIAGVVNWKRFFQTGFRIVTIDLFLIACSWFIANIIRFAGIPSGANLTTLLLGLLIIPFAVALAMFLGGCYRYPLKYFALYDAIRLAAIVSLSWPIVFLLLMIFNRLISIYLAPAEIFILITLLALPRVIFRMRWDREQPITSSHGKQIVIYGAGRAGTALSGWLGNGNMLGFLDDDPYLKGKVIGGKRVLGYESDMETIFRKYTVEEVWVTFRPDDTKLARLEATCKRQNIRLLVLPRLGDFRGVSGN